MPCKYCFSCNFSKRSYSLILSDSMSMAYILKLFVLSFLLFFFSIMYWFLLLLCSFVSSSRFIVVNVLFYFYSFLLAFSMSLIMFLLFSLSEAAFCFRWISSLFIIFISSLRSLFSLTSLVISFFFVAVSN